MSYLQEIKDGLKAKKIAVGRNSVMRGLKNGSIKTIVYASNCPQETVNDLSHYGKMTAIKVEKFDGNSVKLAEICGKPFNISILGVKK